MGNLFTDALSRLPHGPEFRFIDELTSLDPGKRGSGRYRIRGVEPFLKGHFPGQPIFPGVLLVEAGAQLAGVIAQSDPKFIPLSDLRLTALRNVKILGTGVPGDVLEIDGEVNGRLAGLIQATIVVRSQGVTILEASLVLAGTTSGVACSA